MFDRRLWLLVEKRVVRKGELELDGGAKTGQVECRETEL
jgi:hypothetical protein